MKIELKSVVREKGEYSLCNLKKNPERCLKVGMAQYVPA